MELIVSGTAFGFWCQWDVIYSERPDSPHTGSAFTGIGFQTAPAINIKLTKWFTRGALWNETTGAYEG